jgi:hypothetical protein
MFAWCDGRQAFDAWMWRRGHHQIEHGTPAWRALLEGSRRWLAAAPAPHLNLEIGFAHVQTLRVARDAALRQGHLAATSKQDVPARVVHGARRSKVQVRLKGDQLDHVNTDKLSLRIEVDGDLPVLGLRAFSLQAPPTKGFQQEALFHASVRHFGVLSPRYEFVRASYNGDDVGVMALEEHCAKELLERQGRRDSVVVRLAEDQMFAAQARVRSTDPHVIALDDYRTAPVDAFASKTAHSPQARAHQATALALLRAFVAGTLTPAQVFDVHELATYLAVCELWGTWHPLRWHNLRFYFDPMTGRLAPIGFDGNLHMRRLLGRLVTPEEPIVARMLSDAVVFRTFRDRLQAVCVEVRDGGLVAALQQIEQQALAVLHGEYWFLQGVPGDELRSRAEYLLTLHDVNFETAASDAGLAPLLVAQVGDGEFELTNVSTRDVFVHGLRWVRADGSVLAAEMPAAWRPWRTVARKPAHGAIPPVSLQLAPPAPGAALEVEARIDNIGQRHFVRAVAQPPAARAPVLASAALSETLARHAWLRLDDDGRTLLVQPGQHRVLATLVLPPSHDLALAAGTELVFAADAALVVQGAMRCLGHSARPIVLRGEETAGWLGVAVLAGDGATRSSWQHVHVRDTRGVTAGELTFTGGVVFDRGRVHLADVLLSGTRAEDALNIIRADVQLERVHIERTSSDAFDGDFVRGKLHGCVFTDIGGDAADFSGADVTVTACRMTRVRDKALSVGEGSRVHAREVSAEHVGAGAAGKDGSVLELLQSRIAGARVAGVMAYVKKPEFGAVKVVLSGVECAGDVPAVVVQHGSTVVRDGRPEATQAIDVEALYETLMRK